MNSEKKPKAKPPLGESAALWWATEMIDLIFELGSITAGGVVQLQGIVCRLAQGQETILTDLDKLEGWLETRFDGVDKAVNTFQNHQHWPLSRKPTAPYPPATLPCAATQGNPA